MKREVKIGIFAVLMIGCAWAGIRFLSGIDIFSRNSEYYAAYDQINGVQSASPILIQGVKVGTVTAISFDPVRSDKVVLRFTIKKHYRIPEDSEAKIISSSIMGSKAIEIKLGASKEYLHSGDTLRSGRDRDLMDVAGSELDFFKQKISQVTGDLSRTLEHVNSLIEANAASFTGAMTHLDGITGSIDGMLAAEQNNLRRSVQNLARFSDVLGDSAGRMDSIVRNVNTFTAQLAEKEFTGNLTETLRELNGILTKINEGNGTLGSLVNDRELYAALSEAGTNLSSLLADLESRPGRYVHLSLFGRNVEKMEARAQKKAAKAAEKAERDSLRRAR